MIIGGKTVCWTPYNDNFLLVLIKKLRLKGIVKYRGSASSSVNYHSYCSFPIRKKRKYKAGPVNYDIDEQSVICQSFGIKMCK